MFFFSVSWSRAYGLCGLSLYTNNDLTYNSIRFKKPLDIFWPQIQRKCSEDYLVMILAVNRKLWAIFLPRVHLEKEQTPGSRGLKHKQVYAYLTHDFQRHFTLNTSLREWKLLSLYMFHRIIFILLIVSSPSRNFYRCTGCIQSNINISCRNTQNAARKYHSLLKITHNKTVRSLINKGK